MLTQAKAQSGKTSKTVKIANQIWTTENLSVSTYRNGDTIPQIQDSIAWSNLTEGAWCYYENKKENGIKYGKLYNWYAVNDPRGLAPKGFHIPSHKEWTQLTDSLGGAENFAGKKLKSKIGWGKDGVATNETGFNAIPGGLRTGLGKFLNFDTGYIWTSSEQNSSHALLRVFVSDFNSIVLIYYPKQTAMSVRCVKD